MIEYHGNSGVVIDTQRFLGINTSFVGSNEALVQFLLVINLFVLIFYEILGKKPMAGLILQRWHDGEKVDRYI